MLGVNNHSVMEDVFGWVYRQELSGASEISMQILACIIDTTCVTSCIIDLRAGRLINLRRPVICFQSIKTINQSINQYSAQEYLLNKKLSV